jgi:N-acyl-D-aspartate/D-glutamate deacylase
VKERKVLTLEEAVRKMTSWPATRMRLADRGVIRVGAWADVTVFDLDAMKDVATYEKPTELCQGVDYVLVKRCAGARPRQAHRRQAGHVLRGPVRAWREQPASAI